MSQFTTTLKLILDEQYGFIKNKSNLNNTKEMKEINKHMDTLALYFYTMNAVNNNFISLIALILLSRLHNEILNK